MKKQVILLLCTAGIFLGCTNKTNTNLTLVSEQSLQGSWQVEMIDNLPVMDRSPATLIFNENGRLAGNSSCNRVTSSYQLSTDNKTNTSKLTLGQSAGTRMMCTKAQMHQEQRYLEALPKVTQVSIENGILTLTDDNQHILFKASK